MTIDVASFYPFNVCFQRCRVPQQCTAPLYALSHEMAHRQDPSRIIFFREDAMGFVQPRSIYGWSVYIYCI